MLQNYLIFFFIFNLLKCWEHEDFNMEAKEVLRIAPAKWIGEYEETKDMLHCNATCLPDNSGDKPTICDCKKRIKSYPNCIYYFPKRQIDFRLQMTFVINTLRNMIASGEMGNFYLPASSDMNAVSYDMGLEYSSQCSAHRCSLKKETCIKMTLYPVIKQLVMREVLKEFMPMRKLALFLYSRWIKNIMEYGLTFENEKKPNELKVIDDYITPETTDWATWQIVTWSRAKAVGCTIKQTKNQSKMKTIEIFVVCNFGSNMNNPNDGLYKVGMPCTLCDKNISNNNYFKSICGFIGTIPISDIYNGETKNNWEKNRAIYVFGGILFLFCCTEI